MTPAPLPAGAADPIRAAGPSPARRPRPGRRIGRRTGTGLLLGLCVTVAVAVPLPYLTRSLDDLSRAGYGLARHYAGQPAPIRAALLVHATAGGVALLLTTLQATPWLRRRARRLHRALGPVTAGVIWVSAAAGLVIAQVSYAGLVGTLGFSCLALLWAYSAARAVTAARSGRRGEHRAWAVRTVALSAAAVTLRLWLGILVAAQQPVGEAAARAAFDRAYLLVPFLCWVPNLAVAEWVIRRRTTR